MLRRFRLPAAAVAAGLPALLAGMLATPSATLLVGPDDSMVRTVNVDPPQSAPTDEDLGLDGAHPPVDVGLQVGDAVARDKGDDRSRGLPIRVSGTSIPARVLLAYRHAADSLRTSDRACHLHWSVVAGIGKVESGHAYGGNLDRRGRTTTPILGPVLDGAGDFAAIADTDGGRYDGDATWDRAVGPMQFIPSSWSVWGRDGDGNGTADPSDIDDAALATASYLCAGDRDLEREIDRRAAVFSYNHSWDYVDLVLAWADAYATGTTPAVQVAVAHDGQGDDGAGTGRGDGSRPTGPATATTPAPDPTGGPAQPPASAAPPSGEPQPAPSNPSEPTTAPQPTSTVTPEPCPTATPTGSPTGTPTGDPTATPSDTPTPTPTPTPTGTDPESSPSPTPTPTTSTCETPPAP